MTPAEIKSTRLALGLGGAEFARLLGYQGPHTRQMMHELEAGLKSIREPQRRLAKAYRDGYRPDDWPISN
jgi:DNA-binding transcriptional regulator YiaG